MIAPDTYTYIYTCEYIYTQTKTHTHTNTHIHEHNYTHKPTYIKRDYTFTTAMTWVDTNKTSCEWLNLELAWLKVRKT